MIYKTGVGSQAPQNGFPENTVKRFARREKMARPKLTLYFDVVSPFGYLAYYVTRVRGELLSLFHLVDGGMEARCFSSLSSPANIQRLLCTHSRLPVK